MAVENYVKHCQICQQAKPIHTKHAGLLQPLPPPTKARQEITLDFIEGWPLFEGANSILVVVHRLTKYTYFLLLHHPYTAKSASKLFVDNIIRLHGVPLTIISTETKYLPIIFGRICLNQWIQLFTTVHHIIHKWMVRVRESINFLNSI
jgi:hypothetical protein